MRNEQNNKGKGDKAMEGNINHKINARRGNYYLRLCDYKRIYSKIQDTLNNDGIVRIVSYGHVLECSKKHASMFSYNSGGVYIVRGKRRESIIGCTIEHYSNK